MELPPGLIVDAELDAYVSSELSNAVAERLGTEVLHLPGRGHWWMVADVDPWPTPSPRSGRPTELSLDGEAEVAGDHQALDLAGALADLEDLGVAVEAHDRRLLHESHPPNTCVARRAASIAASVE
jgi:hypothetical protein